MLGVGNVVFRSRLESLCVVMVLLARSYHGFVTHVLGVSIVVIGESYSLVGWW